MAQEERLEASRRAAGRTVVGRLYELHDTLRRGGVQTSVQRSDFVTRLAAPILLSRWRLAHGVAPKPRQSLSDPELAVLDALVDESFEGLLEDLAATCRMVVGVLARTIGDRQLAVPLSGFSERIVVWVRTSYLDGAVPGTSESEAFAAQLLERTRAAALNRQQFEEAYRRRYDSAWETAGSDNLRLNPPSRIGLGVDLRPSLLGDTAGGRRDWSQGTNRPVFERYRLWFKLSARATPPRCATPTCLRRAAPEPPDPAIAEVERACSVYGLAQPAHQQIIRSLAEGLDAVGDTPGGWTTWEAWARPCRPIDMDAAVDATLADAVSSAIAAWIAGPVGRPLVKAYGRETLLGPLRIVLARKGWMDLLGYERAFSDPMRRCGIPRLVRTALYHHAPSAVRDWIDGEIGDPDPASVGVGSAAPAPGVIARLEARRRTIFLLAGHPGVVRRMSDGDRSWRPDYEALVRATPETYFSADDAFDTVRDLLEGMS